MRERRRPQGWRDIGRKVRLDREIRTTGGKVFAEGEVLVCNGCHRGYQLSDPNDPSRCITYVKPCSFVFLTPANNDFDRDTWSPK